MGDSMGQLSEALEEFQNVSSEFYNMLKNILEEEYCWKCPMRSTSGTALCREVHAWRKLEEGLDDGIRDHLLERGFSSLKTEALASRVGMKMIKKQGGNLRVLTILIKVNEDQNSFLPENSLLMVKINPKKVRGGDQVLLSQKKFKSPLIGSCALITGFPFQLELVEKFFHEGGIRYVETFNGLILPLTNVLGVLVKVIKPGDANYLELSKKLRMEWGP
jgi:hypothetical protein